METKDNFYEDRFKQLKSDLFIGDRDHVLGKQGSLMLLHRLVEECFSYDEVLGVIEGIMRNQKMVNENPFCFYKTAVPFLKKNHAYIVVDEDNKLQIDYWDGEFFNYTEEPKLVMLYADADKFRTALDFINKE